MSHLTDDELMKRLAQGDQRAFAELFERHAGKILGYACRLMGDKAKAEDVSQDVWLKVVKAAPSYTGSGHFIAWAYTLTRNRALNVIRNSKRLDEAISVGGGDEGVDVPDREELEEKVMNLAEVERVKQEIDKLPDAQRVALVTWLTEDMTYDELAAHMDTSVSAVKSLLFRARRSLEEALGVRS
ncbi:MAG: RNA polymerase sigma factor [Bdellovibrionaceae bacterium]|nr:RNA polymerase sigma factor [Bdellovibrionales bacterium]MCB9085862.1 RNA polymerase sigma factor [Pseudobdellovibrionaceae bacterium]